MSRRRKRKRSKKGALRVHTKQRALERYGLRLTGENIETIVLEIQTGSARFLQRHSNRVTKWEVVYAGQQLIVLYDNKRHTLITALPKDADGAQSSPAPA